MSNPMKHVILDTDIGTDPDDFVALLLALKLDQKDISLDAIVTSNERNGSRARLVRRILDLYGKGVPIFQGAESKGIGRLTYWMRDFPSNETFDRDFPTKVKQISEQFTDVHYVGIGPMSNLAETLQIHPELKGKLKVAQMGGFERRGIGRIFPLEYNFCLDSEAAKYCANNSDDMSLVTANVTANPGTAILPYSKIHRESKSRGGVYQLLAENFDRFYRKGIPVDFMNDPLTLFTLIGSYVGFDRLPVDVNRFGRVKPAVEGNPIYISRSADYKRFMNTMTEILFS